MRVNCLKLSDSCLVFMLMRTIRSCIKCLNLAVLRVPRMPLLQRCVNEIRAWMLCDKLMINNDGKTELIIIGTHMQLSKVHIDSLAVGDAQVSPVQSVKNLGTWIDSNMSLQAIVNNMCRAACYYITHYTSRYVTHTNNYALFTLTHAYANHD